MKLDVYSVAIRLLLVRHRVKEAAAEMAEMGMREDEATVIARHSATLLDREISIRILTRIFVGVLLIGCGIGLSMLSFSAVSGHGGTFYIFHGAVVYGAAIIVMALTRGNDGYTNDLRRELLTPENREEVPELRRRRSKREDRERLYDY